MNNDELNPNDQTDLFAEVRPTGWLLERLTNISNPRRWRWKKYLRACRRIPKSSPVYGSTSWKRINERRHELITYRRVRNEREFRALQEVAGAVMAPSLVAQNFILARYLRQIKRAK